MNDNEPNDVDQMVAAPPVGSADGGDSPVEIERAATRRRASSDAGNSLIEIVITIALMGVVIASILTAAGAAVGASARSRESGQVETALLNASDRVSRAPVKCEVGGYQNYVDAAIAAWQGGGSASVSVRHFVYDSASGAFAAGSWSAASPEAPCPAQATRSKVQMVTIRIVGPSGAVSRTMEVVKGDV
jgi:hypothetical protein